MKEEKHAFMALQNDTNITILLADKENATVLMLDQDYHNKLRSVLNDLL
jgi:predicted 2-oxoglutarate/Fe(II)-dependent dioxygenase YbiX